MKRIWYPDCRSCVNPAPNVKNTRNSRPVYVHFDLTFLWSHPPISLMTVNSLMDFTVTGTLSEHFKEGFQNMVLL